MHMYIYIIYISNIYNISNISKYQNLRRGQSSSQEASLVYNLFFSVTLTSGAHSFSQFHFFQESLETPDIPAQGTDP